MDFELELEEREKNNMEIMLDGLIIKIPENLIEEMMNLYHIKEEQTKEMITRQARAFKECLIFNNEYDEETFEKKYIQYLDEDLDFYRP